MTKNSRQNLDRLRESLPPLGPQPWIKREEAAALVAALDAVLALHRPDGGVTGPGAICVECSVDFGLASEDAVDFPCPTVRAVTSHIEVTA